MWNKFLRILFFFFISKLHKIVFLIQKLKSKLVWHMQLNYLIKKLNETDYLFTLPCWIIDELFDSNISKYESNSKLIRKLISSNKTYFLNLLEHINSMLFSFKSKHNCHTFLLFQSQILCHHQSLQMKFKKSKKLTKRSSTFWTSLIKKKNMKTLPNSWSAQSLMSWTFLVLYCPHWSLQIIQWNIKPGLTPVTRSYKILRTLWTDRWTRFQQVTDIQEKRIYLLIILWIVDDTVPMWPLHRI